MDVNRMLMFLIMFDMCNEDIKNAKHTDNATTSTKKKHGHKVKNIDNCYHHVPQQKKIKTFKRQQ